MVNTFILVRSSNSFVPVVTSDTKQQADFAENFLKKSFLGIIFEGKMLIKTTQTNIFPSNKFHIYALQPVIFKSIIDTGVIFKGSPRHERIKRFTLRAAWQSW